MDFQPDQRSVFFGSLKNNKRYSHLYNTAMTSFKQNSLMINGQMKGKIMNKYKMALDILSQGIAAEKENEKAYFDQLLQDNNLPSNIKEKLSKELTTIFQNQENFQYNKFINLINNILLGEQQYKQILKLEQQRLKQLDKYTKELEERADRGELANKKNSKGQLLGINNAQDLREFLRDEYLEKHSIKKFRGDFKDLLPTVDNIVSDFINKTANNILKSKNLISQIQSIYNGGGDIHSGEFITQVYNNIISEINGTGKNNKIAQIIKNTIKNNTPALNKLSQEVAEDTANHFKKIIINNQNDHFAQHGRYSKAIKEEKEGDEIVLKLSGSNLADEILENENKLKNLPIDWFDLNDDESDISQKLKDLKDAIKQGEEHIIKDKNGNEVMEEEYKKAISRAKASLSTSARDIVNTKLQDKSPELTQEYLKEIRNSLSTTAISISGPTYSEVVDSLISAIKSQGQSFWSGPKNAKADSITITYNAPHLSISAQGLDLNDNDLTDIMMNNGTTFYNAFIENLPKSGKATNFQQGKFAYKKAIIKSVNELKKTMKIQNLEGEERAEALKKIANIMQDTIVVSSTMKTFDTYYNEIGFVSGSIGPNLTDQLSNFQELFNAAGVGMSNTEMTWLETAIVNCSPAALGHGNMGAIEKYLSTMAGFAVFDEGAAELQLIAKRAESFYQENSPKLLHIYKLNGMYFPGSYMLTRIQENLTGVVSQMHKLSVNNDGVHIRANATEAMIPKNIHDPKTRWETTYNNALKSTTMDVSFLSGLFNVVNQLLDTATKG